MYACTHTYTSTYTNIHTCINRQLNALNEAYVHVTVPLLPVGITMVEVVSEVVVVLGVMGWVVTGGMVGVVVTGGVVVGVTVLERIVP